MAGLTKRGKVWYATWYVDGRHVKQSLKTTSRARAVEKLKEIEATLDKGENPKRRLDSGIDTFTAALYPYLDQHKRPYTAKTLKHEWKHFTEWLDGLKLSDATPARVREYKELLLRQGYANSTVRSTLLALSSIFSTAIKDMHLFSGPNPVKGIGLPKSEGEGQHIKYLEVEERAALLAAAEGHSPDLHLVMALGALAGLRKNEIVNAQWAWVNFTGNRLDVQAGGRFNTKSGRARSIPLNAQLRAVLERYRPAAAAGYIIYPGNPEKASTTAYRVDFTEAFSTVCKAAGVGWATPHTLRHTFASHLAMAGVSLYKIGRWLGHSDAKTTQIYAHLAPQDGDIDRI